MVDKEMYTDTDPSGRHLYRGELYLGTWKGWPTVLQVQQCSIPQTALRLFHLASARDDELTDPSERELHLERPVRDDDPLTIEDANDRFGPIQPVWRYAARSRDGGPQPEIGVEDLTRWRVQSTMERRQ